MASTVPPGSGIPGSDQLAFLKTSKLAAYLGGVLAVILGLAVLVWPDKAVEFIIIVFIGIALAIVGIAQIIEALGSRDPGSYWGLRLLRGVLDLGVGIVAIFWPGVTAWILVLLFGIELLFAGFLSIFLSTQISHDHATKSFALWRGIISVLAGIVLLVWPKASITVVIILLGVYILFAGLLLLYIGFQLGRAEKAVPAT